MDWLLLLEQLFNSFQYGIMLFLIAAGLTLVFGIMDLVNLAHGSFIMIGAYFGATFIPLTDSFLIGSILALIATFAVAVVVEKTVLRTLYERDHMDQVLATFGLILFFNELVVLVWGATPLYAGTPKALSGNIEILPGAPYPTYRLAMIAVGIALAIAIYFIVAKTRIGMLIRAGASNREMLGALGVNVGTLFTLVFAMGCVFSGLAGIMISPISTVESGMGDPLLIVAFVIIIIGGIGSIRGAFVAALIAGMTDTIGRTYIPELLRRFTDSATADTAGPALASMLIYLLMALVLVFRPAGLFAAKSG